MSKDNYKEFDKEALCAEPVFYRTYSRRKEDDSRETFKEVCQRAASGLKEIGDLSNKVESFLFDKFTSINSLPAGRWLWIGGTEWSRRPENHYSAFNCSSLPLKKLEYFGLLAYLAMQGCGTGAVLEERFINQLPTVRNRIKYSCFKLPGERAKKNRLESTVVSVGDRHCTIYVGDSKEGWRDAYQALIDIGFLYCHDGVIEVEMDLSSVRPKGEVLKGFGGVANPSTLSEQFRKIASIISQAQGRNLTAEECCLLIDEMASAVVSGNIRRCVVQHEVVATKDGMKPIKDVEPFKDLVLTHSGDYKPVTDKFYQGVQEVIEVKTDRTSLKVTPKHKMAVYSNSKGFEWVQAGNLKAGDRLINIPHLAGEKTIDTDWAWLLGLFIANGYADNSLQTKKRNGGDGCVIFSVNHNNIETIGTRIVKTLTTQGFTPFINNQSKDCTNYCIYRKELALELLKVKKAFSTPCIPKEILLGDAEVRSAFLAGSCDGDGQSGYSNVLLNSNKLDFLKEVQKLYTSLGIATNLHETAKKSVKGKEYEGCHWLNLKGLQSEHLAKALIEPFASRVEIYLKKAKKWGLRLPMEVLKDLHQPEVRKLTNNSRDLDSPQPANWDTLIERGLVNPEWQPLEVISIEPCGEEETYDIEVDGDACFIAAGMLVSNSAGMRQFDKNSELLKMNLWQPDQQGNWRIDPKRDALRMANHTRNYYSTPSLEEMTEAVRSQFYSGEGAIFWAPESLARTNSDLFPDRASKNQFINTFLKDNDEGLSLLESRFYEVYNEVITSRELDHRMRRTATNPCLEGNTLVLTDKGDIPIKDLVDKEVSVWTGKDWETVDNFRITGKNQDVYKVQLFDGRSILATNTHTFILDSGLRIGLLSLKEGDILKSHSWYYDQYYGEPLKSKDKFFKNAKVKSITYYGQEDFVYCCTIESTHSFALSNGIMVGNCGEILGSEFLCCLSEIPLTELDPWDYQSQKEAFQAGGLSTASLLHLKFQDEDMQYSREIDPIIGVGFTGLFDFFVTYFGVEWLEWWSEGRPKIWSSENWPSNAKEPQSKYFQRGEKEYLNFWRSTVYETVKEYCENNGLRVPNRYTCVKPSGTMSNLSKSSPSPGWHPPKALYYIRRITFRREDPVALACIDYGYNVVPSQSDKDENGNLLHDPYDPRCTEWLVEIPMKTAWADMEGADNIDPSKFSALAQLDFALTVQQEYVTHNTSSTIELRESEIEELAEGIHKAIVENKGYVSAALLGRFDDHQSYPRLPFEPIDKATYYERLAFVESNRSVDSFYQALNKYDVGEMEESGPSGCDSDKCTMPE